MIKRVFEFFEYVLPLNQLNRIFDLVKKVCDLVTVNAITFAFKA